MNDKSYLLIPANRSWLRRLISPIVRMDVWWMTYRLPFQKQVRITFSTNIQKDLAEKMPTLLHEEVHVEQFSTWYGPWLIPFLILLFPLPVFFSGRWFIERDAYLVDIKAGRTTVNRAVDTLWDRHGWVWPKPWMQKWFRDRV